MAHFRNGEKVVVDDTREGVILCAIHEEGPAWPALYWVQFGNDKEDWVYEDRIMRDEKTENLR